MADAKTYFEQTLAEQIKSNGDKVKEVDAIFLFKITGDGGGEWTVNLKDDIGVTAGDAGNSECQIECSSENWATIQEDPSSAMQLFFSGDLQVGGNAMLATKLQEILGS
ncbi:MAG: SCP2 sterol-binding domain-containing protein [Myxococcota bacterium]